MSAPSPSQSEEQAEMGQTHTLEKRSGEGDEAGGKVKLKLNNDDPNGDGSLLLLSLSPMPKGGAPNMVGDFKSMLGALTGARLKGAGLEVESSEHSEENELPDEEEKLPKPSFDAEKNGVAVCPFFPSSSSSSSSFFSSPAFSPFPTAVSLWPFCPAWLETEGEGSFPSSSVRARLERPSSLSVVQAPTRLKRAEEGLLGGLLLCFRAFFSICLSRLPRTIIKTNKTSKIKSQ